MLPVVQYMWNLNKKILEWYVDYYSYQWAYKWNDNAVAKGLYNSKLKEVYDKWNRQGCLIPLAFDSTGNAALIFKFY